MGAAEQRGVCVESLTVQRRFGEACTLLRSVAKRMRDLPCSSIDPRVAICSSSPPPASPPASASGWFGLLADRAARAASQGTKHKSCILLWMEGGPAQSHTFDLKPGSDYKPIPTAVPGIQISEHLPKIAKQMQNLALLRSMKHRRRQPSHCDLPDAHRLPPGVRRRPGPSRASARWWRPNSASRDFELPNYVAVGNAMGPGYLGPKYAPLVVNDFERGLPDLQAVRQPVRRGRARLAGRGTRQGVPHRLRSEFDQGAPGEHAEGPGADALGQDDRVRAEPREGFDARSLRPKQVRPGLPARPAAGRGRRAVCRGRARRLGHAPGSERSASSRSPNSSTPGWQP